MPLKALFPDFLLFGCEDLLHRLPVVELRHDAVRAEGTQLIDLLGNRRPIRAVGGEKLAKLDLRGAKLRLLAYLLLLEFEAEIL